jgi:hypothetical protein
VYRFLRDEVGASWIQFIPVIERLGENGTALIQQGSRVSERSVRPEQFGRFPDPSSTSGCDTMWAASLCRPLRPPAQLAAAALFGHVRL